MLKPKQNEGLDRLADRKMQSTFMFDHPRLPKWTTWVVNFGVRFVETEAMRPVNGRATSLIWSLSRASSFRSTDNFLPDFYKGYLAQKKLLSPRTLQ